MRVVVKLVLLLLSLAFVATVVIDFVGFATLSAMLKVLDAVKMTISIVILYFVALAFAALDVVNPTFLVFEFLAFLGFVVRSMTALLKRSVTVPVSLVMSGSVANVRH